MASEQTMTAEPTRIIPFGYIERTCAGAVLVINKRAGFKPHRFTLDERTERFLSSLEVWRIHHDLPEEAWSFLDALQQRGVLAATPVWLGLNVIPVLRDSVVMVSTPSSGFHTLRTSAGDVGVTELGSRLLHMIDGERTVDTLVDEISDSMPDAPRTLLESEALWFIQSMRQAGAMTLEPAA